MTGANVALKKIIMHNEKDGVGIPVYTISSAMLTITKFPITALREIKLLKLLSHPNVLKLEDMAVEHPHKSGEHSFHLDQMSNR